MRKFVFSSAVITGGIFLTGLTANAAVTEFLGTPTDPAALGTARTDTVPQVGFGFFTSTTANQQMNELGIYVDPTDSSGTGVTAVAHTVTLLEYNGNNYSDVSQAVIPAGSTPDSSGYAWASVPTINLNNNGQNADYYILVFSAGTDVWYNGGTQTVDSDFGTITNNGWVGSSPAPTLNNTESLNISNQDYFGANIGFSGANVNAFNWVATSPGDFLTGSNWDQGVAPSNPAIHLATISNGGTATISTGDSVGVLDLYVGDSVNTTSTGNSGGTLVQTDGVLTVASNLAIGNAGTGVGTFTLSGGTVNANNVLVGGGVASTTGGVGSVTQSGGTVNVSGSLIVGNEGGTGSYNFAGGTITASNLIVGADLVSPTGTNGSIGTLIEGPGGTLNITNDLEVGQNFGVGAMNITGGTVNYTGANNFAIRGGFSTPSVVSLSGSAVVTVNSTCIVGYPNNTGGGEGILNISGNASYSGGLWAGFTSTTGIINMTGGSVVTPSLVLGYSGSANASSIGILNISGGSITATTLSNLGYNGEAVINLSGSGSITQSSGAFALGTQTGGNAVLNQSGGTLTALSSFVYLGEFGSDQAVWNMSGGVANTLYPVVGYRGVGTLNISGTAQLSSTDVVSVGNIPGSTGTVNLNGGTLTTMQVLGGGGNATFNMNGGVLVPYSNNNSLIYGFAAGQVNALVGGAIVNTNGFNANITASISSPGGVIGRLIKQGAGTLLLTGSNTYTGATTVSGGTLQLKKGGVAVTVPNGSFEIPANAGGANYAPTGAGVSWSFSTNSGGVTNEGSGITNGTAFNFEGSPPDGSQAAFIQQDGYIYQALNFPVTGNYDLSFYTEQRGNGGNGTGAQTLDVVIGTYNAASGTFSSDFQNLTPGGSLQPTPNWAITTYTFAETAGTHTVSFSGLGGAADVTAYVDLVTLNEDVAGVSNILPSATPVSIADNATLDLNGDTQQIGSLTGTALSAVTLGYGTLITGNDGTSTTFAGVISGTGSFVKVGTGTQTLSGSNTYSGGTNVSGGQLVFNAPGALPLFTSLTIGAGASATAANVGAGSVKNTLFVTGLTLAGSTGAWTGRLDLANNDMVVRDGSLATITNQIALGYASGTWQGSGGIVSSAAAADSKHLTALGVIQNSADGTPAGSAIYSTFDGQLVSDVDVLVKYTYYGDANLDGAVDGSDYTLIDNGFNNHLTGWYNGDFNYDGKVDGSDYTLIDNAFNTQGPSLGINPAALIAAQISGGASAVPEPSTLGLLGVGTIGLLARRRRVH